MNINNFVGEVIAAWTLASGVASSVQKITVYICEHTRVPVLFQNMVRGTQTVETNSDETFPEKYI